MSGPNDPYRSPISDPSCEKLERLIGDIAREHRAMKAKLSVVLMLSVGLIIQPIGYPLFQRLLTPSVPSAVVTEVTVPLGPCVEHEAHLARDKVDATYRTCAHPQHRIVFEPTLKDSGYLLCRCRESPTASVASVSPPPAPAGSP